MPRYSPSELLGALARQARIAVRVEQDGLRRDQGALAVEREPAALGDERRVVDAHRRAPPRAAAAARASSAKGANLPPQALKPNLHRGHAAAPVDDEDRPVVAHPRVVDRDLGDVDGMHRVRGQARLRPGLAITVTGSKRAMASTTAAYSASASASESVPELRPARPGDERACVLGGSAGDEQRVVPRTRHHGLLASGRWWRTSVARARGCDTPAHERAADVVVIGGGLFGTSIAYQLCRRGAGRVILLERDALGSGDSGRTFGMVRRHYSNAVTALLAMRGSHTIMHWAEEVGIGDPATSRRAICCPCPRRSWRPRATMSRGSRRSGSRRRSSGPPRSRRSSRCSRSTASPGAAYEPDGGFADAHKMILGWFAAGYAHGLEAKFGAG